MDHHPSHPPTPSDDHLEPLIRAAPTNLDALEELLRIRRPALLAFALRQMGPRLRAAQEAEDIVQDATKEAFRSIPRFVPGPSPIPSFDGWLYRITERAVIAASRKRYDEGIRQLDDDLPNFTPIDSSTPSRGPRRAESSRALADAINQLPENYRAAITTCYLHGLTLSEAADELAISPSALNSLLHRARAELRCILESGSSSSS